MSSQLPRVTYSNISEDFTPVHDRLDAALSELLAGGARQALCYAGGRLAVRASAPREIRSPVDRSLVIAHSDDADAPFVRDAVRFGRVRWRDWARRPAENRFELLERWVGQVSERKYDIAAALVMEAGKSHLEAIGEVEEVLDMLPFYRAEFDRSGGFRRTLSSAVPRETSRSRLVPYGVFAVIGPFNYPVAVTMNMMLSALIMGNVVVFKPSSNACLSATMLIDAARSAGLPPEALQVVLGGDEVGRALVEAPIDGVVLVGSTEAGLQIRDALARSGPPRPLIAEMGGKNVAIVCDTADLDVAAEGVMRSAFGLSGQKCSACEVVLVDRRVHDAFLEKIVRRASQVVVGDPRSRRTFMGPVIDEAAKARWAESCAVARDAGARVLLPVTSDESLAGKGPYVPPTVVADLARSHPLARKELFLPWVSVHTVEGIEQALADAAEGEHGLTAGLYSRDPKDIERFEDSIEAGVLYVNRRSGATTGAWPGFQTFGGWKRSGMTGKNAFGSHYLQQFGREQSLTVFELGAG